MAGAVGSGRGRPSCGGAGSVKRQGF